MSAIPYFPRLLTTWFAAALMLAACTPASSPEETNEPGPSAASPEPTHTPAISLPDLGPAPEISNEVWLNTDKPLSLAALRGKVVLVEFWTFG